MEVTLRPNHAGSGRFAAGATRQFTGAEIVAAGAPGVIDLKQVLTGGLSGRNATSLRFTNLTAGIVFVNAKGVDGNLVNFGVPPGTYPPGEPVKGIWTTLEEEGGTEPDTTNTANLIIDVEWEFE